MKKIFAVFLACLLLFACGCSPESEDKKKEGENFDPMLEEVFEKDAEAPSALSGKDLLDEKRVKWLGRHYYANLAEGVFFSQSASGFEVKFYGTRLTVELSRTNAPYKGNYLAVAIDSAYRIEEFKTVSITKDTETLTLAENLEEGNHVVKVYKKDESVCGKLYLQSIETDGYIYKRSDVKNLKIEVFGDSITCGYGVDSMLKPNEAFDSSTEDVCDTYAFLTAKALNADLSVLASSGWGMCRGLSSDSAIPQWFKKADVQSQIEWNVAANAPDIVLICLGANDNTYINEGTTAEEKENRLAAYKRAYVNFVSELIEVYPEASIVCCYGFLNEIGVYGAVENIVEGFQAKGEKVYGVRVRPATSFLPLALHGHPSKSAHRSAAQTILSFLEENNIVNRVCDIVPSEKTAE